MESFISDLLGQVSLVDLIKKDVALKKTGANRYTGLCPFHKEKTPSFVVNTGENNNYYYCFGCFANGDAIAYLKDKHHTDFKTAVVTLAEQINFAIPTHYKSNKNYYNFLASITQLFANNLKNSNKAKEYLQQRKISQQSVDKYFLGYSTSFEVMYQHLSKEYPKDDLDKYLNDLVLTQDKYNLQNRLVFPISDRFANIKGFTTRDIDNANSKFKYINSYNSKVFNKYEEYFGLYQAWKEIKQTNKLFLVEGSIDVISMAQAGYANTIAVLGSRLNKDDIKRLANFADEIIICFDGDSSGKYNTINAVYNNILPALQPGKKISIVNIPDNLDPDSLINQRADYPKVFDNPKPLSQFLLEGLFKDYRANPSIEDKDKIIEDAKKIIVQLPIGYYRSEFAEMIMQQLGNHSLRMFDINKTEYKPKAEKNQVLDVPTFTEPYRDKYLLIEYLHTNNKELCLGFQSIANVYQKAYYRLFNIDNNENTLYNLLNNLDANIKEELLAAKINYRANYFTPKHLEYLNQTATNSLLEMDLFDLQLTDEQIKDKVYQHNLMVKQLKPS